VGDSTDCREERAVCPEEEHFRKRKRGTTGEVIQAVFAGVERLVLTIWKGILKKGALFPKKI